jgi:hypothetical protein
LRGKSIHQIPEVISNRKRAMTSGNYLMAGLDMATALLPWAYGKSTMDLTKLLRIFVFT